MDLSLNIRDQRQIVETRTLARGTLDRVERRAELVVGGGFVAATAIVLLLFPPQLDRFHPAALMSCLVAYLVALRAPFDMGSGFTVPIQVAFVPMLFAMPPSLVPVVVVLMAILGRLPEVLSRSVHPVRLIQVLASSWFCIGPALVLALQPAGTPAELTSLVLLAAFGAQLAGDACGSYAYERLRHGATGREQLRELWVYAVDLALTPLGLAVAWHVQDSPWVALAVAPVLVVIRVFSRERRGRIDGLVELNNAYRGTALVLSNVIDADDHYTGEHCRDVVVLSMEVGQGLGLDDEHLRYLEFAALLHDVGKVAIPKEIINKPGKLDPDEWEIIKTHTVEGQRMLAQVGGFMGHVGRIVRSHHERWDGHGYPDGISGEAIPIEARIVTVCDSWNAMTTTRPYRAAMDRAEAEQELRRCAGTQFDPEVVAQVLVLISRADRGLASDEHVQRSRELATLVVPV